MTIWRTQIQQYNANKTLPNTKPPAPAIDADKRHIVKYKDQPFQVEEEVPLSEATGAWVEEMPAIVESGGEIELMVGIFGIKSFL